MSDISVDIVSVPCGALSQECIEVPTGYGGDGQAIIAKESFKIIFGNKLSQDAKIYFYENGEHKKNKQNEIDSFCKDNSGNLISTNPLVVASAGTEECVMHKGWSFFFKSEFSYRIEADTYTELDPVIIIKPRYLEVSFFSILSIILILGLAIFGIRKLLATNTSP